MITILEFYILSYMSFDCCYNRSFFSYCTLFLAARAKPLAHVNPLD